MIQNTVHAMYLRYRAEVNRGDESASSTLRQLYESLSRLRYANMTKVVQSRIGDEHDALEIFDDAFMYVTQSDTVTDISRVLSAKLRGLRVNYAKAKAARTRLDSGQSIDAMHVDAEDDPPRLPESAKTTDDYAEMKRADQRQLIDSLIRAANPDAMTLACVKALLTSPVDISVTAVAKPLGLHHEIFKRKLLALGRKYNGPDWRDCLTV